MGGVLKFIEGLDITTTIALLIHSNPSRMNLRVDGRSVEMHRRTG
jgi:hypothetical protein